MVRAARCALMACVLASLCGCTDREARARCGADRTALQKVLEKDQQVSRTLHGVDDLALDGKPLEGADRIGDKTRVEMDGVVREAEAVAVGTKWGAARKQELVELAKRRRRMLDEYEAALRSEKLERVVGELEKQRDLERRALAIQRGIQAVPDTGSGSCDPP